MVLSCGAVPYFLYSFHRNKFKLSMPTEVNSGKLYSPSKISILCGFQIYLHKVCKIILQLSFISSVSISISLLFLIFLYLCFLPSWLFFLCSITWSLAFFPPSKPGKICWSFFFFLLHYFLLHLYYLLPHTSFDLLCCSFPSLFDWKFKINLFLFFHFYWYKCSRLWIFLWSLV